MIFLTTLFAILILAGCSTTPNTEQQMMGADARMEARAHLTWCRRNDGVFVEDDTRGNKCYRRDEFNAAIQGRADNPGEDHERMNGYTAHDGVPTDGGW